MTGKELVEMYKKRIPLTVKFNDNILDVEGQFEENMIADIVGINFSTVDKDGCISVVFDESNYKKINLSLEKNECINENGLYNLKWSQLYKRINNEVIYESYDDEIKDFDLIDGPYKEVIDEYLSLKTDLNYIDWLHEKIYELKFYKDC